MTERHNVRIAIFMGAMVTVDTDGKQHVRWPLHGDYIAGKDLRYHNRWQSIKPVINKLGLRITWIEWLIDPEYVYNLVLEGIRK
jgi:hypothetical protein